MLVLSRKVDERIRIGDEIWITVLKIQNGKVRIGVEADPSIQVLRDELVDGHRSHPTERYIRPEK
jgi:carbon storage regulator